VIFGGYPFDMILIFGVRARVKKIGDGVFFCQRCGADRHYVLQQIRRWFTLFFVPIFPVGKALGEQVKCETCGTSYRPEVLNAPTSASLADSLRGATRVASVAMIGAGDRGNPAARTCAISVVKAAGAETYDETWLSNDLDAVDPASLFDFMAPLANGLTPPGKEAFLAQIARVGLADGPLNGDETKVLERIGEMLGLSAAHVRGIIVSTTPQSSLPEDAAGDA
jgi:hypothetical protein